jgi:hypothetical protein
MHAEMEDYDPVVAEYDVYITPEVEEQQLYILQYLNRPPDQPFTKATQSQPTELRVKKESGFVEVDIPIDIHQNYNRPAGVRWLWTARVRHRIRLRAHYATQQQSFWRRRRGPRSTDSPGRGRQP